MIRTALKVVAVVALVAGGVWAWKKWGPKAVEKKIGNATITPSSRQGTKGPDIRPEMAPSVKIEL